MKVLLEAGILIEKRKMKGDENNKEKMFKRFIRSRKFLKLFHCIKLRKRICLMFKKIDFCEKKT